MGKVGKPIEYLWLWLIVREREKFERYKSSAAILRLLMFIVTGWIMLHLLNVSYCMEAIFRAYEFMLCAVRRCLLIRFDLTVLFNFLNEIVNQIWYLHSSDCSEHSQLFGIKYLVNLHVPTNMHFVNLHAKNMRFVNLHAKKICASWSFTFKTDIPVVNLHTQIK